MLLGLISLPALVEMTASARALGIADLKNSRCAPPKTSIRLPNGSRIYPKTIEGFEAIEMFAGEDAIVVMSVDFDGTETTTVLWHPDGPTGGVSPESEPWE